MDDREKRAKRPRLARIRPRSMAFDSFFAFVYTLVGLACIAQLFLIVWPLIF